MKPCIFEMMGNTTVTAFFPAYNDRHTIEAMVRAAAEELVSFTNDFEVLVVNDGSKDDTGEILDRLAKELSYLRVIHHEGNQGYGAALITGFKNAAGDVIFYTDGDGQYDVREMGNLFALLEPHIDLVNGFKIRRADAWYRVWIGECYRQTMRKVFHLTIRDVDCDFRLFRRHVFDRIVLESRSGVICVEMAKKFDLAGFRMVEAPVSHYPRLHGRSEFFRVRHLVHTFKGLMRIWWNLVLAPRLPLWMTIAAKKS